MEKLSGDIQRLEVDTSSINAFTFQSLASLKYEKLVE
jgi:hypothetical protein